MKKFLFVTLLLPITLFAHNGEIHAVTSTPAILQNIVDTDRRAEIVVDRGGAMTLRNVRVVQIAGSTFFTRLSWDEVYLRVTVKTSEKTKFYRRFGELTTRQEIKEGDYLNVEGMLESGGNTFGLIATSIVNIAVLKENGSFNGSVVSIGSGDGSFVLRTKKYGEIKVIAKDATITRGSLNITAESLKPGDRVLSVSGEYNHADRTLVAKSANVFIDMAQFKPRNYKGTLLSLNLPSSITLGSEGQEFTISLNNETILLNKARNSAPIRRFVEGDDLIVYGATSELSPQTITAEVVRNLSL